LSTFLDHLLNGLLLGGIFALIAVGYSLVYGIIKLINFAHGEVAMFGAFFAFFIFSMFDVDGDLKDHPWIYVLAMVVSIFVTMGLGWLLEFLAYRPLRKASRLSALITAIGASLLLQYLAAVIWSPSVVSFEAPEVFYYELFSVMDGDVLFEVKHLVVFMLVSFCLTLLWWVVEKTRMGKAMRACSQDADAAALMGININRVVAFTFIFGSAMAALSGVLYGLHLEQVRYNMGIQIGIVAFAAAVLGGIGSIPGAVLGGFVIGFTQAMASGYLSDLGDFIGHPLNSGYTEAVAFMIMILCLIVKPNGLLGKGDADRA